MVFVHYFMKDLSQNIVSVTEFKKSRKFGAIRYIYIPIRGRIKESHWVITKISLVRVLYKSHTVYTCGVSMFFISLSSVCLKACTCGVI